MPQVNSRATLIEYCKYRLGFPVVEINVDDDQVDDRVNDTIQFYQDYHFSGTTKEYFIYTLTQPDIDNKFIPIPDDIIYVSSLVTNDSQSNLLNPMGDPNISFSAGGNLFNGYGGNSNTNTATLNSYTAGETGFDIASYYLSLSHYNMISKLFATDEKYTPIRFNRHTDKVYIDTDWSTLKVDDKIVLECLSRLNPDINTDVYNDRWVKRYLTAQIKLQWGTNLYKFSGISMLGGVNLDGDKLYDQARQELNQLEEEMQIKYELPPMPFMG